MYRPLPSSSLRRLWPALLAASFTWLGAGCGDTCYTVTTCGKLDLLARCHTKAGCVAPGPVIEPAPGVQPALYSESEVTIPCRGTLPHNCDRLDQDVTITIDLTSIAYRLSAYPRLAVRAGGVGLSVSATLDGDPDACRLASSPDARIEGAGCILPSNARTLVLTASGYSGSSINAWLEETSCTLQHEVCDR